MSMINVMILKKTSNLDPRKSFIAVRSAVSELTDSKSQTSLASSNLLATHFAASNPPDLSPTVKELFVSISYLWLR